MNSTVSSGSVVLACVDQSAYASHVTEYAIWAAKRLNIGLELLHVIDRNPELAPSQDHSGSIGINEQENLLKKSLMKTKAEAAKRVNQVGGF